MGQVGLSQTCGQLDPHLAELFQHLRFVQVILDKLIERQTLGPFHFQATGVGELLVRDLEIRHEAGKLRAPPRTVKLPSSRR